MAAPKPQATPSDLSNQHPSQSLYVQNLPEKIEKQDLRRALYMLFSTYGPVLDITAMKTKKMRGQAHVLFKDMQSANQALRSCQGFEFYGREMKISYAKKRSDALAKMTGTFRQPEPEGKPAMPAQAAPGATSLQQSIFSAPPGARPVGPPPAPTGLPPPPAYPPPRPSNLALPPASLLPPAPLGLPQPPALAPPRVNGDVAMDAPSPQGEKRKRDEPEAEEVDEDEGSDAPMEEEDEGSEMEMSEDDE